MFGLEKEKKAFQFDLEVELKKNPKKAKETLAEVESKIETIKKELRQGKNKKEIDDAGILLHGYTALKKVISSAIKG